jgi:hypothetical protein
METVAARYERRTSLACSYAAPLDTLPLFVRGGAIVPMWPKGTLSWQTRDKSELDYDLYPQGDSGYTLYEDDGVTRQFAAGSAATQRVQVHAPGGGNGATVVKVGPSEGDYAGKPAACSYRFAVHGDGVPGWVVTDGGPLQRYDSAAAFASAASGWYADPTSGVVEIKTLSMPTDRGFSVELVHGSGPRA